MQGVALHPALKLIATASSDATVRIYKNRKLKNREEFFHKFTIKTREDASITNVEESKISSTGEANKKKSHRLFLDDTEYQSFVRRLSFSPDGSFMLTPSSWYQDLEQPESGTSVKFQYTVYGFLKNSINKPSFMLPGIKTHANCIRFCPLLLKLKENVDGPAILDLPYRLVFAVATID